MKEGIQVLILTNNRVSPLDKDQWGLLDLNRPPFTLYIADISAICSRPSKNETDADIIKVESPAALEVLIASSDYVKIEFNLNSETAGCYEIVKAKARRIIEIESGPLPAAPPAMHRRIFRLLADPDRLRKRTLRLKRRRPDLIFTCQPPTKDYSLRVHPISSYDWVVASRIDRNASSYIRPFTVYIDQGFLLHPDRSVPFYRLQNEDRLYGQLRQLFSWFEGVSGASVVVCAHPRVDYSSNPFGGRPILRNQLAEAIANADYVLAHSSTSIQMAVIFQKPVVLIDGSCFNGTVQRDLMRAFAHELRCDTVSLDDVPWLAGPALQIDKEAYAQYMRNFVLPVGVERGIYETVRDVLYQDKFGGAAPVLNGAI